MTAPGRDRWTASVDGELEAMGYGPTASSTPNTNVITQAEAEAMALKISRLVTLVLRDTALVEPTTEGEWTLQSARVLELAITNAKFSEAASILGWAP